jgi:hypothetical protein
MVFLPPKGFDWGFLLYFSVFIKHATHSGWILTYLLPSLYSYQIEVDTLLLKKRGFAICLRKRTLDVVSWDKTIRYQVKTWDKV